MTENELVLAYFGTLHDAPHLNAGHIAGLRRVEAVAKIEALQFAAEAIERDTYQDYDTSDEGSGGGEYDYYRMPSGAFFVRPSDYLRGMADATTVPQPSGSEHPDTPTTAH